VRLCSGSHASSYSEPIILFAALRVKYNKRRQSSTDGKVWYKSSKYVLMSHQNAMQNCNIYKNNKSLKNVAWFKYFGVMMMNKN
jgi:hypothetical protein